MAKSIDQENRPMKCSIQTCSGKYEIREIVHPVRHHGKLIVIDHVPAEVCAACGDVLLEPKTIRRIEQLLDHLAAPTKTVPLYEYA